MNNTRIEKLYMSAEESKGKDFRAISDYIVDKYVYDPSDGEKLTQEQRDVISEVSAIDMTIGAESKKVEYLLIGSAIGIVGTLLVLKIKKTIKKRKALTKLVVEDHEDDITLEEA